MKLVMAFITNLSQKEMNINQFKTFFAALGVVTVGVANAQTPIKKFIDPANMDLNVKPGDDFYQYASGTWVLLSMKYI